VTPPGQPAGECAGTAQVRERQTSPRMMSLAEAGRQTPAALRRRIAQAENGAACSAGWLRARPAECGSGLRQLAGRGGEGPERGDHRLMLAGRQRLK